MDGFVGTNAGGDCPNFCVNKNGTVPFRPDKPRGDEMWTLDSVLWAMNKWALKCPPQSSIFGASQLSAGGVNPLAFAIADVCRQAGLGDDFDKFGRYG
jgi:hypothetical protein